MFKDLENFMISKSKLPLLLSLLLILLAAACTKNKIQKFSYAPLDIDANKLTGTITFANGVFKNMIESNFSILLKKLNFQSFDKNDKITSNSGFYIYNKLDKNIGILILRPQKGIQAGYELVVTLKFLKKNSGTYIARLSSGEKDCQHGKFILTQIK